MEITLETVVFYFLAAFITVFSLLTVTTTRMVRSATYLLFVLFGTAGIYFLLGSGSCKLCLCCFQSLLNFCIAACRVILCSKCLRICHSFLQSCRIHICTL